ncbi:MAG: hypothetical protein N2561_00835 [Bacteroidetes bacterium]|nr:hypothetical protein [Bacteroidota bacterium]MCX7906072.1 hypothetical protein [Bacteroidota bacterium]MDW8138200.1 hypothetical protein [Bacteroidota bacterium]
MSCEPFDWTRRWATPTWSPPPELLEGLRQAARHRVRIRRLRRWGVRLVAAALLAIAAGTAWWRFYPRNEIALRTQNPEALDPLTRPELLEWDYPSLHLQPRLQTVQHQIVWMQQVVSQEVQSAQEESIP